MVDAIGTGSVLILGDGNFSFTGAFCRRSNVQFSSRNENDVENLSLISSVRETKAALLERYPECEEHVRSLEARGIKLLYDVDATRLDNVRDENGIPYLFDHIIFNFPHTGGKTNLKKSRQLLVGVFIACQNVLKNEGRFYLTLACGQSGLGPLIVDDDQGDPSVLPRHIMDSWQPLHLAAYGQMVAECRKPFLASEWSSHGYMCAGYKNTSRRFRVEGAETLIFRRVPTQASVDTLANLESESNFDYLHSLRPYFVHDIAFWITDSFRLDFFVDVVRSLSKGLVKRVIALPQYSCTEEGLEQSTKTSLCFRFVWQSADFALTREAARDLQLSIRDRLPVELLKKHGFGIQLR